MPGNLNHLRNFILAQQLDRGPDFTQEHQRGKVYNTPIGDSWRALQEAIERSGEINRGPGFKRENYGFGGNKPWSSPNPFLRQEPFIYDPTIEINPNDFLRKEPFKYDPNSRINPKDYLKPYRSGELNQLSPSGIDNYNSGSWNSGMKDWR